METILLIIIIAIITFIFVKNFLEGYKAEENNSSNGNSSGNYICKNCGCRSTPQKKLKGNYYIALLLWLFLLVPGIIYSIWRRSSSENVCQKCGSTNLIPIDTPEGKRMMENTQSN